jgi:hypothetical protein
MKGFQVGGKLVQSNPSFVACWFGSGEIKIK